MSSFILTIASPEGNIFDGEINKVILRGALGDLAILARHEPFMTTIKPGEIKIELPDGSKKTATCDGGILTVDAEGKATIISGSLTMKE